jgi:hypothetical protein
MRTHRSDWLVTLLAAVAVTVSAATGCKDDPASTSSGAPGSTSSGAPGSTSSGAPGPAGNDFFARYAKAVCERTFTCCDAAVRAAHNLDVSSVDECAAQLEKILVAATNGGAVHGTFVPAKGEACIDEISTAPCSEIQILGDLVGVQAKAVLSCNDAWDGAAAEGETCGINWDCVKDHCVYSSKPGGPSTSACKAPAAVGEPCESLFDCEDGLRCDQPSPPSAGTCATRSALGGSCKGDLDCQKELRCGKDGACEARVQEGGPCLSNSDCTPGMRCAASTCAPVGAAGAPCNADSDCASSTCVDATSTCADVCKEP